MAQLAKALSWEAVDCGFESHQNLNLLQIFLQNHTKMAGNSNIIIGWWPINFEEESYAILTLDDFIIVVTVLWILGAIYSDSIKA